MADVNETGEPDWRSTVAGQQINIPLKPNPNAAYIITDNTLVLSPPPTNAELKLGMSSGSIEILFMRTAIEPQFQLAEVQSRTDENASVALGGFQMAPYSQELGRARLDVDSAINMATAILKHAMDHNDVDIDVIVTRLIDRGINLPQLSE